MNPKNGKIMHTTRSKPLMYKVNPERAYIARMQYSFSQSRIVSEIMLCNKIFWYLSENARNDKIDKQLCMLYVGTHYFKQEQIEKQY